MIHGTVNITQCKVLLEMPGLRAVVPCKKLEIILNSSDLNGNSSALPCCCLDCKFNHSNQTSVTIGDLLTTQIVNLVSRERIVYIPN